MLYTTNTPRFCQSFSWECIDYRHRKIIKLFAEIEQNNYALALFQLFESYW